jgi:hypothetical protein
MLHAFFISTILATCPAHLINLILLGFITLTRFGEV